MLEDISGLKKALRNADRVAILTGAGISAESGVPTFRGPDGLWQNYQVTDLATPEAFARDPELVWRFYNWRRRLISRVSYNRAHEALAEMERFVPYFTLITQNVDGLHISAGSRNVLEIHGNLWKVGCTLCGKIIENRSPDMGTLPRCKSCGGLLRPQVVWFGEALDPDLLGRAVDSLRRCQIMLKIGTSGLVEPAASLSLEARSGGAVLAEINTERTPYSDLMDFMLKGKAGDVVPRLTEGWK